MSPVKEFVDSVEERLDHPDVDSSQPSPSSPIIAWLWVILVIRNTFALSMWSLQEGAPVAVCDLHLWENLPAICDSRDLADKMISNVADPVKLFVSFPVPFPLKPNVTALCAAVRFSGREGCLVRWGVTCALNAGTESPVFVV